MNKKPLILPAPAKINRFLHITGRRADGYHELQTLFQLIDYGDELQFSLRSNDQINLLDNIPGLPPEQNLVVRAAIALQQATGCTTGADIKLIKKIPAGGGLGGGSSDAATTLLGLNHLWGTQHPTSTLLEIAQTLGADVPVFVQGNTAWGEGIGEQLEKVDMPSSWVLVIKPDCEVSTARLFSHPELTRDHSPITIARFLEQGAGNDFEPLVRKLYPAVDQGLNWLGQYADAQLTGTGACLFALFADQQQAQEVLKQLPKSFSGFVAATVNRSPLHEILGL
ncbi:MAG: 4-(cytidine 5'-diphospho)-2-C-methyl-D-erythritol kinase [Pseudomonadales bacterium]|nr:4-(cytidine 5'-diphospho)-2-C-methyl-D-erythritol kinase [Pseudomonadales bacterium]